MKKQRKCWKGKVIFREGEETIETMAETIEELLLELGKNPIEYVAVVDGKIKPLRARLKGKVIKFYDVGSKG